MRHLLQKSRLQHLIQSRNGYLILAGCSAILNVLLAIFLFFTIGHERIIVVPPEIQKSFWITSNRVSPEYLSEMALFLNSLSFNITPSNANTQHKILLRYVDSSYYEALKIKLIEVEDRLKKGHVTMTFYPSDYPKVDLNKLIVRITGDLHYNVGDIQIPPKRVIYEYKFHYTHGHLTLISYPEVKNNA